MSAEEIAAKKHISFGRRLALVYVAIIGFPCLVICELGRIARNAWEELGWWEE